MVGFMQKTKSAYGEGWDPSGGVSPEAADTFKRILEKAKGAPPPTAMENLLGGSGLVHAGIRAALALAEPPEGQSHSGAALRQGVMTGLGHGAGQWVGRTLTDHIMQGGPLAKVTGPLGQLAGGLLGGEIARGLVVPKENDRHGSYGEPCKEGSVSIAQKYVGMLKAADISAEELAGLANKSEWGPASTTASGKAQPILETKGKVNPTSLLDSVGLKHLTIGAPTAYHLVANGLQPAALSAIGGAAGHAGLLHMGLGKTPAAIGAGLLAALTPSLLGATHEKGASEKKAGLDDMQANILKSLLDSTPAHHLVAGAPMLAAPIAGAAAGGYNHGLSGMVRGGLGAGLGAVGGGQLGSLLGALTGNPNVAATLGALGAVGGGVAGYKGVASPDGSRGEACGPVPGAKPSPFPPKAHAEPDGDEKKGPPKKEESEEKSDEKKDDSDKEAGVKTASMTLTHRFTEQFRKGNVHSNIQLYKTANKWLARNVESAL